MLHIGAGQRVGDYQVTGFLGRGAFAQVFAAEGPQGVRVALKVGDQSGGGRFLPRFAEVTSERDPNRISPDETPAEALFLDPAAGARAEVLDLAEVDQILRGEALLLRAASHPATVRLLDLIEPEDRPVLVLELLSGATIRERIRSLEGVKLRWVLEAMRAVEHEIATGAWSFHGDIKPDNLFVSDDDRIRVLDPVPPSGRPDLILATPHYNPFLLQSGKGDAHSFAILLYELLCGGVPFAKVPWEYAGTDPGRVLSEDRELSRSFYLSYPRLREVNIRAPRELERAIYHTLCDADFGLGDLRRALEDFLLV